MFKLLDNTPTASTAMQHTAVRHREILADYSRDFRRTQVRGERGVLCAAR
jgi:Golgi SNAP receptor complex protein 1